MTVLAAPQTAQQRFEDLRRKSRPGLDRADLTNDDAPPVASFDLGAPPPDPGPMASATAGVVPPNQVSAGSAQAMG